MDKEEDDEEEEDDGFLNTTEAESGFPNEDKEGEAMSRCMSSSISVCGIGIGGTECLQSSFRNLKWSLLRRCENTSEGTLG